MPITQAQKDGIVGKIGELETLVNALVADQPAQQVPPPTANTYISASHPGTLTTKLNGVTLGWQINKTDAAGITTFIANGSFGVMVKGTKLVLQNGEVYAKQADGTWLRGGNGSVTGYPVPASVVIVDPAP